MIVVTNYIWTGTKWSYLFIKTRETIFYSDWNNASTIPLSSVYIGYQVHFIWIKIPGFYLKYEDHSFRRPVGILVEEWSDRCFIWLWFLPTRNRANSKTGACSYPLPHVHLWKTSFRKDLTLNYLQLQFHSWQSGFQPWEKEPDIIQSDNMTLPKWESGTWNREEDRRDHGCLW